MHNHHRYFSLQTEKKTQTLWNVQGWFLIMLGRIGISRNRFHPKPQLLMPLLSLKCKLVKPKTVGEGGSYSWKQQLKQSQCEFLFVCFSNLQKCQMPSISHIEGNLHLFQKQGLSVQKQAPYALYDSKSLSFVYILLIFSPQVNYCS